MGTNRIKKGGGAELVVGIKDWSLAIREDIRVCIKEDELCDGEL